MTYKGDLFIAVKISVEPVRHFGWADNRKMVPECSTDSLNYTPNILNSESFPLQDQLLHKCYRDINRRTTNAGDLFIEVKSCVEPATLWR